MTTSLALPLRPKAPTGGLWYVRVETLHLCDTCKTTKARYDAYLPAFHTWAFVCEACAQTYEVQLGMGCGQLLLLPDEEVPA